MQASVLLKNKKPLKYFSITLGIIVAVLFIVNILKDFNVPIKQIFPKKTGIDIADIFVEDTTITLKATGKLQIVRQDGYYTSSNGEDTFAKRCVNWLSMRDNGTYYVSNTPLNEIQGELGIPLDVLKRKAGCL